MRRLVLTFTAESKLLAVEGLQSTKVGYAWIMNAVLRVDYLDAARVVFG